MQSILNIAGLVNDSIVDGPGIRFTVFAQGCSHNCEGCHNPETHEFGTGVNYTINEILREIQANPLVRGVTFSGGDPFFQAEGFAELAKELKKLKYEVACYTGFTWEYLIGCGDVHKIELLKNLDVLVDGPFILAKKNLDLLFRGSSNQRIIDVQKSLEKVSFGKSPVPEPVWCTSKRWVGDMFKKSL
ncbi:MAG: anaerobic ribonucleoside-triphosphate reductase activating protein [Treponemataceae bacterium]|nr:anaerobic ribonucleoside-triphosphate reductase activating protein [Treponemataceae bacterium]